MAKANVTSETRLAEGDEKISKANGLVEEAGNLLKQPGFRLLGSVTIHYYQSEFSGNPTYQVQCQQMLQGVEEGLADYGHKNLKEVMMKTYGRELPKTRT